MRRGSRSVHQLVRLSLCITSFRDEFVSVYIDIRQRLTELKIEVEEKIVEHDRQREEVQRKLNEAILTEPEHLNRETGIRNDAILKVHVVDAVNLPTYASTQVQVSQGVARSET